MTWHQTTLQHFQQYGTKQQLGALQWHNGNETVLCKTKVQLNKEVKGYKYIIRQECIC